MLSAVDDSDESDMNPTAIDWWSAAASHLVQLESLGMIPGAHSPLKPKLAIPFPPPIKASAIADNNEQEVLVTPVDIGKRPSLPLLRPTPVIITKARPGGGGNELPSLNVTDLSSAAWCETQWLFTRTYGRSRAALACLGLVPDEEAREVQQRGRNIHAVLEVATNGKKVTVAAYHKDDKLALRFLESILGFYTLLTKGITRELPVRGIVTHHASGRQFMIWGIIDQLEIVDGPDGSTIITLTDHKTRRVNALPPSTQREGTWMQLATYAVLLRDALAGLQDPAALAEAMGAVGNEPLGTEVQAYIRASSRLSGLIFPHGPPPSTQSKTPTGSLPPVRRPPPRNKRRIGNGRTTSVTPETSCATLLDVMQAHHVVAASFFDNVCISPNAMAKYIFQETGQEIGELVYPLLLVEKYEQRLQDFLGMILGQRTPAGVDDVEQAHLKCGNCEYAPVCAWRDDKVREMQRAK
ncbi:exonuclease V [Blastocladiella britannica]|nr:exonuclease V [Blastocladiella britannica]